MKRTTTLTLTLTAALGTAGLAYAAVDNPFALTDLKQGYQVAANEKAKEAKCGEGKCGTKTKPADDKAKTADDKAKEAKCGEGKCGSKKK